MGLCATKSYPVIVATTIEMMLPSIPLFAGSAVVDADDLTREIDPSSIDDLVDAFKARGAVEAKDDEETDDASMRRDWRAIVDKLHALKEGSKTRDALDAELLLLTHETDEYRANELLDLGEKLLLRVLGNVAVAKTNVNVVTSQQKSAATLNLYERGVKMSALAYGIGDTPIQQVEDFLASRAAVEFELLMLHFLNTDTLQNAPARLTMRMQSTGRSLEIQQMGGHKAARALASAETIEAETAKLS